MLWKARQVTDVAGGVTAPMVEGRTRGETKRRRVEAVREELRSQVAGGWRLEGGRSRRWIGRRC
jgi:hypothetical protein